MESWGLRRGEQSEPTRVTMVTQTQADPFPSTDSSRASCYTFGWLTGGIRKGTKGEPPVAIFYSFTSRPANFLALLNSGSANFFLFIHRVFGIRHDPGGTLSVRLVIESCSASLFSRGSFHQQQATYFQTLDLLCPERPRVFVLAK